MSAHTATPIELVDGHYPSIKEIKGLSFSLTIVVQANDLSFKDEFDRLDDAARIVKTWNAHDELVSLLKAVDNKLEAMHMYHSGPAASAIRGLREKIVAALTKAGAA